MQGESYVQAVLEKKRAAADFLPTISFSPTYQRNEGLTGPRRDRNNDDRDTLDLPANLVWNLFDGYRDVAALYRNAATIRQKEALLRDLESSLMLDVVNAFYASLRAQRSIVVLESSLKLQEERVRDIIARRDAGVARPLDVAQTQAVASEARVALISAKQEARNARHVLTLLLDVPVEARELKEDLQPSDADRTLESWLAAAMTQRQDLQAATAGVVAAGHEIQNAFGQYYPSVTLNLEYLLTFNRVASETGWNAALRLYIPIFTAGQIDAEVRIAWSQARQAVLNETYTQRLIRQQVTTTYGDWKASANRLDELNRKLEAASIAYEQADSSYNVGLATNLERLDAQDRLLFTELDIANEYYFLRQAYLSVMRASGLLDGRVIAIAQRAALNTSEPAAVPDAAQTTEQLQNVKDVGNAEPAAATEAASQ